jgi:two-component system phosphate regulon sensor histidine kinase PhoR
LDAELTTGAAFFAAGAAAAWLVLARRRILRRLRQRWMRDRPSAASAQSNPGSAGTAQAADGGAAAVPLDEVLDCVDVGMVVLDRTQSVASMNAAAARLLSVDAAQARAKRLAALAARSPQVTRLLAARREPGADCETTELALFADGRDRVVAVRELPWRSGRGETAGTILLLQDVTTAHEAQRANSHAQAEFSKSVLAFVESMAESLGHALGGGTAETRLRELAERIGREATRLRALAARAREARGAAASHIDVLSVPLRFERVVRDACATLEAQAQDKRVRLEVAIDAAAAPVRGDPVKLPWVVTNLAGSALRYTPAGGTIAVRVTRADEYARVIISDTGPGIEPEAIPRLFDAYAQRAGEFERVNPPGLGLALVKEIVQAHGGRIFVESAPGRGTTFTVDIPATDESAE